VSTREFPRSQKFGAAWTTVYALLTGFGPDAFRNSDVESVLVIFVLRTRGNPLNSRPHLLLATTSVTVVGLAVLLPFTPLGAWFGFVPPSASFLCTIAVLVVCYLLLAQSAKWAFYRLRMPVHPRPRCDRTCR